MNQITAPKNTLVTIRDGLPLAVNPTGVAPPDLEVGVDEFIILVSGRDLPMYGGENMIMLIVGVRVQDHQHTCTQRGGRSPPPRDRDEHSIACKQASRPGIAHLVLVSREMRIDEQQRGAACNQSIKE
jgi:hypothetical protein